jgi:hypothetical protein
MNAGPLFIEHVYYAIWGHLNGILHKFFASLIAAHQIVEVLILIMQECLPLVIPTLLPLKF